MANQNERIEYLDGLRGIAIVAVVLFHGYVAFPERLPFGERFGVLPIRLGWQGVELFFLISGFVILMTLEKSDGLLQFARKRWVRLFPAMLLASLITFLFLHSVGQPHPWMDLIPGLTFISPALIHAIFRVPIESLDGSYWSLYVEVVFYAAFGTAFFLIGEAGAVSFVFSLFLVTMILSTFPASSSLFSRSVEAAQWIGFIHFGWFASGAIFYRFSQTRSFPVLLLAISVGVLAAVTTDYPLTERLGLLVVVSLFAASLVSRNLQRALSWQPLLFIGFISYPLYLIHYAILNVFSNSLSRSLPWVPDVLVPAIPIATLVACAWMIARFWEPLFRVRRHREWTNVNYKPESSALPD